MRVDRRFTCANCGAQEATTTEHVPRKAIFMRPGPSDLITVPACFSCNNRWSAVEEQFGVYLAMLAAHPAESTWSLWGKQALRTLRHNRRLAQRMRENLRPVAGRSPGGLRLGEVAVFPIPQKVYTSVIEKTIRGLYYHHYRETLGDSAVVRASMFRGLSEEAMQNTRMLSQHDVGGDSFIYRYGSAENSPLDSVWVFQFYGCHWAFGQTAPVDT